MTFILLLLTACSARAEKKEHSRFALSENERIIQYVDENQERPFCWLALQKGGEEPVIFWSREAGDVIEWAAKIGVIADAAKAGEGEWAAHIATYGHRGVGIPILYERGTGVTNMTRVFSGAGATLTLGQQGANAYGRK